MNENVTPEALARLEAMEKAATPRPWHVHGEHVHAAYDNSEGRLQHHAVAVTHDLNAGRYGNEGTKATNAALILAARNALPDLIAEIRRLRAAMDRLPRDTHGEPIPPGARVTYKGEPQTVCFVGSETVALQGETVEWWVDAADCELADAPGDAERSDG